MNSSTPALLVFSLAAFVIFSSGCNDPFDYHPWELEVPEERKDLNTKNIDVIKNLLGQDTTSFNFAIIGDPHFYYDDLSDVLEHIKYDLSIKFIIVVGDITDQALMNEFEWYSNEMIEEGLPFVTVIGNHDHLANGKYIYEEMFGERNFVFTAGGVRFVIFDNVEFESDVPVDHPWLSATLTEPFTGQTLLFMHIQPTDVQMSGTPLMLLEQAVASGKPNDVFMGHLHRYDSRAFPDGTRWTTAPWPRTLEYLKVIVTPDTTYHRLIEIE